MLVTITVPFTSIADDDLITVKPDPVAEARGSLDHTTTSGAAAGATGTSPAAQIQLRPVDAEDHFGFVLHIIMSILSLFFCQNPLATPIISTHAREDSNSIAAKCFMRSNLELFCGRAFIHCLPTSTTAIY